MVVPVGIEPTSPQLQSGANPFQLKNHVYTSCHSRHPVGCRNGVNRTPSAHALGPKPSAIPIGDIPFLGNTGERGKIPPSPQWPWSREELNLPHGPCKGLSPPWYMRPHILLFVVPTNFTSWLSDALLALSRTGAGGPPWVDTEGVEPPPKSL